MPWRPGQSGNPSGARKRGVREAARKYSTAAVRTLAALAGDPDDPDKPGSGDDKARASAANSLLTWAHGPPAAKQLCDFTDAELRDEVSRRARLERQARDAAGPVGGGGGGVASAGGDGAG